MNDKFFLDTNIFVYSFDDLNQAKKQKAGSLINKALKRGIGIISTQVIQEFFNVALHKFENPFTIQDSKSYLDTVLLPLCEIYPDIDYYKTGLDLHTTTGYSFYDALIITAAQRSDCNILYSEDLQDGHRIGKLTIINPF